MSNPFNGSKQGKRGGNFRPSRVGIMRERTLRNDEGAFLRQGSSATAMAQDAAKYLECSDIRESIETHIVPRKSLTEKLHLRLFPQTVETAQHTRIQTDKRTGKDVVTTDDVVVWRSDKTLLRRGIPSDLNIESIPFKFQTPRSKRKIMQIERPAVVEESTETDIDITLSE